MFNIKNIVNKITDRGRESPSNSPAGVQGDDILSRQVAEGFLCPKCMKAFASQEELKRHYESSIDGDQDQSEGFLCPKCMKPCSSPEDLKAHFLKFHGAEMSVPLPWEESERVRQQGEGLAAAEKLDIQALTDPEELKRLLIEALECKNTLVQEKERLEQKASQLARDNVSLKAASDEGEGNQLALRERLKVVEAQLAHRESIDDAAVLRQELVQVQRVMDELTREKERERDELKAELQQLKDMQAAKDTHNSTGKLDDWEVQLEKRDATIREMTISLESHKKLVVEAKNNLKDKITEFDAIKHELGNVTENLQQQEKLNEVLQSQVAELQSVEQKLKEVNALYDDTRKINEEKDEEVKTCQAKLDALIKQKEILLSELQHKTKSCEELEKNNSGYLKDLSLKKDEISRLELERAELLTQIEAGEGANTAIQQLSQEKVLLMNQLKDLTESYSENVERLNNKLRTYEIRHEERMVQVNSIGGLLRRTEAELHHAREELDRKIVEVDELRTQNASCVEINDTLKSSLKNNSKMLAEAGEKVKILNDMVEECGRKLNDLEAKKSKMEGKVREKEMEMNKLHADMNNLETRLADSMLEVKQLQGELNTEKLNNIKLQENLTEHEKKEEQLIDENKMVIEKMRELEESLAKAEESIREKEEHLNMETAGKEAVSMELTLEKSKCIRLEKEKLSNEHELDRKVNELKKVQASLDEVAGEKLALEAQLSASQSEQQALLERCYASSAESENQRKNNADVRRRLEESQAALHELGRENQTLQLELEKLVGRKWTEDSDAISCTLCLKEFSILVRKHHCRNCGQIFCNECSSKLAPLQTNKKAVRVCDSCYKELSNK